MRQLSAISFAVALLAGANASATTFTMDVGKQSAGTTITLPAPGNNDVTFRVVNRRPDQDYTYSVVDKISEIGAFATTPVSAFAGPPSDCAALVQIAKALDKDMKESDIATHVDQIEKALTDGVCTDAESLRDINEYIARTRFDLPGSYPVPPGHQLTLTVTRKDGDKTLTWTLVIDGGSRGIWLTTYGATVVPDKDETFFSEAASAQGKFNIVRQANRDQLKAVPSVFFTWLSRSRQDKDWSWGPTAGLGVKTDRPAVFVGGTLTYNWNLGIVAGIAVVQESRLNGKYQETDPPQTVSENLSADQLNVQTTRFRPFVGITFRFGSNPFTSSGGDNAGNTDSGAAAQKPKK